MPQRKDVILHIYKLAPADGASGNRFISSFLPSIGMGTYHTCLEFDDSCYTFASNAGIVRTSAKRRDAQGVPPGASFQESIELGDCERGYIQGILSKLEPSFGPRSYHLVHRNCNHFTETLATALFLADGTRGKKYPTWINRLAKTSMNVIGHDDDILPCDAQKEAREAAGVNGKEGSKISASSKSPVSPKNSGQKKQLTEKQKAALAKIRGGK